jgi:Mn-dependent DtxR family transcriptional regulator
MFWSKKEPEFDEVDQLIQQKPGIRPADVAKAIKVSPSTISRRLPSMEEAGYLYYEDDDGKLYPFEKKP